MSKASTRHSIDPNVMQEAIEAYALKAEIEAREANRADPYQLPIITMVVLLLVSAVLLVAQCVFLPETV